MNRYAARTASRWSTVRNVVWLVATVVILVLLFGYKTSTGGAPPASPTRPPASETPAPSSS